MEIFIGFVLGLIADVARSIILPVSNDWLIQKIPVLKKQKNLEENVTMVEIMGGLKSIGKDPALAKHAKEDTRQFLEILDSQRAAFVENSVELIDSTYMTQAEMNTEAHRSSEVAQQQVERALIALERSGLIDDNQISVLRESQEQWKRYALSQARFAAARFEGGTMAPQIFSGEYEFAAIQRAAELKRMLEEIK